MECPKCGYEMQPFDTECLRCKRMAAEGREATPLEHKPEADSPAALEAPVGGSPALLRTGAFFGSLGSGTGAGYLFGSFLSACWGGG